VLNKSTLADYSLVSVGLLLKKESVDVMSSVINPGEVFFFCLLFLEAKVNIAGLSARQLRQKIQQKSFTRDTKIQVSMQHYEKKRKKKHILTVACCNYSNLYVNMTFVCTELQIEALKTAKRCNPKG